MVSCFLVFVFPTSWLLCSLPFFFLSASKTRYPQPPWGPVIESSEGRTECQSLIKNATENTYIIQITLMPLVCQHQNDPENKLLLKDFTGNVEQVMERKRKSPVLNHVLNSLTLGEMKIRGTDLAWRLLFDQRWHDILLTSSPCYGRREKSALLRFNGFHLYRVGVTTSNILKILA